MAPAAPPGLAVGQAARPLREVTVAKIVIKARLRSWPCDGYLMQLDRMSRQFQLIGGHREETDRDDMSTAIRELTEELPHIQFELGNRDLLSFLGRRTITAMSSSAGVTTRYCFAFFHLRLHHRQLQLGPDDRWITLSEVAADQTKDAQPVRVASDAVGALSDVLPGGLADLAYSLRQPQEWMPIAR